MENIGLFYASSTGNTKDVADSIANEFEGDNVTLFNIDGCELDAMNDFSKLIIGVSTWGEGELQDDWEDYLPHMKNINFSGKTVALFGLGDQEEYCDNFLDAMGTLYEVIVQAGGTTVGSWPTDGYDFDESTALRDSEFVGLALDEDNQFDLTSERIKTWTEQIKPYFQVS